MEAAASQVFGHDGVLVGRGDEACEGHSERATRDQARREVAEVARRDRHHQLGLRRRLREFGQRVDVVEGLGEKAADVDRVGGGEGERGGQGRVGECLSGEALAVVEGAADGDGRDVAAQRGELGLLAGTDLAERIEDHDADARKAVEGVGDGTAGVAGCGGEDRDWGRGVVAQRGHHAGHEARADVLEGVGGAVEELEEVNAGVDLAQGNGEVQRVVGDGAEEVGCDFAAEEVTRGDEGPLGEGEVGQGRAVGVREGWEGSRDEQPAIGSLAEEEGVAEGPGAVPGAAAGADQLHGDRAVTRSPGSVLLLRRPAR